MAAAAAASPAAAPPLGPFYDYVDAKREHWIERLAEAVAIESVSSDPARRPQVNRMMQWAVDEITRLGGTAELHALGEQAPGLHLPPILTGRFDAGTPGKPTVLLYGHLDVQPADMADGWHSEPFKLTIRDGKMYGRGSTDDKGPVLAWLWVVESYRALGKPLPVNIKLLLEGMEESGSLGLHGFIERHPAWFHGVDFTCISDNYFLGPRKPCLTYGLRGLTYFSVEVRCASRDLHSGVCGGPVAEAMVDMVKLLATLHAPDGSIAVPGIMDTVRPFTDAERATYADIDFNPEEFRAEVGAPRALRFGDKEGVLSARWRFPSLSIHGIEGAWAGEGAKTVIPHVVRGKFSIRIVPDMEPADVEAKVRSHLTAAFAGLHSPNTMKVSMLSGAKAWLSDYSDANYTAARHAIEKVFGVTPDYTREGGSIPVTLWLQDATKRSVMLLPIGGSDDGAHSQDEKLNVENYINGIKVLGTYLEEISTAPVTPHD